MVYAYELQVYFSLSCALLASAAGVYLHLLWNIGGLLTTFATIGCMTWMLSTHIYEEVLSLLVINIPCLSVYLLFPVLTVGHCGFLIGGQRKRVGLFLAAALFEGASIGPLIDLAIQIDPRYMSVFSLCP